MNVKSWTVLFCDANDKNIGSHNSLGYSYWASKITDCHLGGANYLFKDLHVSNLQKTLVETEITAGGKTTKVGRFIFDPTYNIMPTVKF